MAYLAWRAFKCFRVRRWVPLTFLVALTSAPFVFYAIMHMRADAREEARNTQIAALERSPIPKNLPATLEVHGHLTEKEILIYLDVFKFKEVAVLQRPTGGEIYGQFITLVGDCEGLGVKHLAEWRKRGRFSAPTKQDKACLDGEWKHVPEMRDSIEAIEYRHGTQATLVPEGSNWADGAYEIRLRANGTNKLIKYWERPYVTRPSEPGPWGYAFPANTNSKSYKKPKRLDFLVTALEAK